MALAVARRPVTVTVSRHRIVGLLMDAQILAGYAEQAVRAVSGHENEAPRDVALDSLGRLQSLLRAECGALDGIAP